MIFRIYHETAGGHVHMRVFAGKRDGALGKCGDLCMRVEEFEEFRNCSLIDFRPETISQDPQRSLQRATPQSSE